MSSAFAFELEFELALEFLKNIDKAMSLMHFIKFT